MKQLHNLTLGTAALLALVGCTDSDGPSLLAPERPSFAQSAASPVVNSLNDVVDDEGCDDTHCSLREAIAFARNPLPDQYVPTPPPTITFAVTGTITLTGGDLLIDRDLTINGPGANKLSVSGNNASRIFYISPYPRAVRLNVSLSGLTIMRGSADFGGGIFVGSSALTLQNSVVTKNRASQGGGIGTDTDSWVRMTIQNSTISDNEATNLFAGGLSINSGASLTLHNSTVSGNTAPSDGAGLFIWEAGVTITHSTITENRSGSSSVGAGILNFSGRTSIQNSIIAKNTGGDCFSRYGLVDLGYNLIGDGGPCKQAATSKSGDPLLGPLADNGGPTRTHALLNKSPAIDAIPFGSNGCSFGTDQRGVARPQNGACDIGAFEFAKRGGGSNNGGGGGPKGGKK
jgi:CSLREA domain-containing protein